MSCFPDCDTEYISKRTPADDGADLTVSGNLNKL
jgi:hypothetical protein